MLAMTTSDAITAFSALIAAVSFTLGVSAWKREFVGKRRIELAESVLAKFYEAADAIRAIRSPFSRGGEGRSRKRSDYETPGTSEILDQAHVALERYQRRSGLFAEVASAKYRFMAAFGAAAGAPFDEVRAVVHEIMISAEMLGTVYWPRQGRIDVSPQAFEAHLHDLREHEAIFWTTRASEDKITPRVEATLREIERFTQLAVNGRPTWWVRARHLITMAASRPRNWQRNRMRSKSNVISVT